VTSAALPLRPTAEEIPPRGSGANVRGREVDAFRRECGFTRGCIACRRPRGSVHTKTCKARRREWLQQKRGSPGTSTATAALATSSTATSSALIPTTQQVTRRVTGKRSFQSTPEEEEAEIRDRARPQPQPVAKRAFEESTEDVAEELQQRVREDSGSLDAEASEPLMRLHEEYQRRVPECEGQLCFNIEEIFALDRMMNQQVQNLREKHAVAEEPEIFVGDEPGYTEDWKELPYQGVLEGRFKELKSIREFDVVCKEIPENQVRPDDLVIPMRFLYRMKEDGAVKARLVVQQIKKFAKGVTWMQTFAACPTSLGHRVLLWYAMKQSWPIREGDVSTAFLHADLPKDLRVLVRPPSCIYKGMVWILRKALYGLKIAPRCFQQWFAGQMSKIAFKRCLADPQLYFRSGDKTLQLVHADDDRFTSAPERADTVQDEISKLMRIRWDRELGKEWTPFLGLLWRRASDHCIQVKTDPKHFDHLLQLLNLESARGVRTPMWSAQVEQQLGEDLDASKTTIFRTGVGIVQWIALVRADIQYSAKELARGLAKPTTRDKARLRRLARYCKQTRTLVLNLEFHPELPLTLRVWGDSDLAKGESRKSTTGYVLRLQNVLLSTASKTQSVVALSSAEAELLGMSSAVAEALFAQSLLQEFLQTEIPIEAYTDSKACLGFIGRQGLGRMKHIETKFMWLQQVVQQRGVTISCVPSHENQADVLTKQLLPGQLEVARRQLGLIEEAEADDLMQRTLEPNHNEPNQIEPNGM